MSKREMRNRDLTARWIVINTSGKRLIIINSTGKNTDE
jgi:hypothetical protein